MKTAAVTGASRGIGRATALALARQGYRVFALARSGADLAALVAEAAQNGVEIVSVPADMADEASWRAAVAAIMEATDGYGVDVLVNNAGYGLMGPVEEISLDQFRNQLEVNLVSVLGFTQPFAAKMRERRRGWIVNISSTAGRVGAPFSGAYAASKAGLEAMTDALRIELSGFGVHVILIEPGPIRTSFSDVAQAVSPRQASSPYAALIRRFEEGRKGWYIFQQPPESVANAVVKAVQAQRPRARYTVTLPAMMTNITRRLVPDAVSDWGVRRVMTEKDR